MSHSVIIRNEQYDGKIDFGENPFELSDFQKWAIDAYLNNKNVKWIRVESERKSKINKVVMSKERRKINYNESKNQYKILQNSEITLDYKSLYYDHMKEGKIICDYIVKELEDIKKLYEVEVMMKKALELVISKLVDDQVHKSEELKKEIKEI